MTASISIHASPFNDKRLHLLEATMTARCLGACGVALAVVFDDQLEGHQTVESVTERLNNCLSASKP